MGDTVVVVFFVKSIYAFYYEEGVDDYEERE